MGQVGSTWSLIISFFFFTACLTLLSLTHTAMHVIFPTPLSTFCMPSAFTHTLHLSSHHLSLTHTLPLPFLSLLSLLASCTLYCTPLPVAHLHTCTHLPALVSLSLCTATCRLSPLCTHTPSPPAHTLHTAHTTPPPLALHTPAHYLPPATMPHTHCCLPCHLPATCTALPAFSLLHCLTLHTFLFFLHTPLPLLHFTPAPFLPLSHLPHCCTACFLTAHCFLHCLHAPAACNMHCTHTTPPFSAWTGTEQ